MLKVWFLCRLNLNFDKAVLRSESVRNAVICNPLRANIELYLRLMKYLQIKCSELVKIK